MTADRKINNEMHQKSKGDFIIPHTIICLLPVVLFFIATIMTSLIIVVMDLSDAEELLLLFICHFISLVSFCFAWCLLLYIFQKNKYIFTVLMEIPILYNMMQQGMPRNTLLRFYISNRYFIKVSFCLFVLFIYAILRDFSDYGLIYDMIIILYIIIILLGELGLKLFAHNMFDKIEFSEAKKQIGESMLNKVTVGIIFFGVYIVLTNLSYLGLIL